MNGEITAHPIAVSYCIGCGRLFEPRQPRQKRCQDHCGLSHHSAAESAELKPFIAIDGEGGGTNELGQQNYLLLCARGIDPDSAVSLFRYNKRLTTEECLEFILGLPRNAIIVGFFFDYDVTQILRDLPPDRLARLLLARQQHNTGRNLSPYTYWKGYGIEYVPKQYLRVVRESKDNRLTAEPGSCREINEVGGFFQKSFTQVIREWKVTDDKTVAFIEDNKARRAEFTKVTSVITRYCQLECELLAMTMEKLRSRFIEGTEQVQQFGVSLLPSRWRGAGYVASKLLDSAHAPRRDELPSVPKPFMDLVIQAYYGGRFEISRTGLINQKVYEYDINSAYPAAMPALPCAEHTIWREVSTPTAGKLYIGDLSFEHPSGQLWCGFPFRGKSGHLYWPRSGSGSYWSVEIEEALKLGATVNYHRIYQAETCCDCKPFSFVPKLYEFRKSLGKGAEGYPIKLGLNALYGKLAQRKGAQVYHNLIHAGLITAITRAKLMSAVRHNPEAVVMLATDGVYSTEPLPLELGSTLGTWESKEHPNMFIVQPGLYWFPDASLSDSSHKTRGIPRSIIQENAEAFRKKWTDFALSGFLFEDIPYVPDVYNVSVPINTFIGFRLALHRGNPSLAGSWHRLRKNISFDWRNKRDKGRWFTGSHSILHFPIDGSKELRSAPYDPSKLTEIANQERELEASPDFVEMVERE